MAFAAPLITGFLSDIGLSGFVAEGVSGAVGSEAAGTFAGNAVQGAAAAGLANKAREGLEGIADSAFGQGFSQNAEQYVSRQGADARDIAEALMTGDYEGLARKKRQQRFQIPAQNTQNTQSTENQNCKCEQVSSSNDSDVPTVIANQVIQRVNGKGLSQEEYLNQILSTNKANSPDQQHPEHEDSAVNAMITNQKIPDSQYVPLMRSRPVLKDPESTGHDLGRLISLHTTAMQQDGILQDPEEGLETYLKTSNRKTIGQSLGDISRYNPGLAYLVPKIIEYDRNIGKVAPDTELYKKIAAVYNGFNITPQSVKMRIGADGLKEFAAYDEVGFVEHYKETTGLKLPTLWPNHVWTGPNSPNNNVPYDLWDTFSYYHDCGYQEHRGGWFSLEDDYKYISRLVQNMNRFPQEQHKMIKGTIVYFSTLGHTLAQIKGSLKGPIDKQVVPDMTMDDIFATIMPDAQNMDQKEYTEARQYFYSGIVKGLEEETSKSSVMAVASNPQRNLQALRSFDRLMIQLV